jgi:hypothetical protein
VEAAAQLGIHTMQPVNGVDWTVDLYEKIRKKNTD